MAGSIRNEHIKMMELFFDLSSVSLQGMISGLNWPNTTCANHLREYFYIRCGATGAAPASSKTRILSLFIKINLLCKFWSHNVTATFIIWHKCAVKKSENQSGLTTVERFVLSISCLTKNRVSISQKSNNLNLFFWNIF